MRISLDTRLANELDFETAYSRILSTLGNSLVFSPHGRWILKNCESEVIASLKKDFSATYFNLYVPLYLSCPKKRAPYHRKGAYLYPKEMLLYQALVDSLIEGINIKVDKTRVYSNRIDNASGVEDLFVKGSGFFEMQNKFKDILDEGYSFALKTDLVSYYSNINLHELQNNLLTDIPEKQKIVETLDKLLIMFSESNSQGLVQGYIASDILANYYLTFLDKHAKERDIPSYRYMDDLYFFFRTKEAAGIYLYELESLLMEKNLYLNEHKTYIVPSTEIIKEVSYVDDRFEEAKEEVKEIFKTIDDEDVYFKIDAWDYEEGTVFDEEDIELEAVKTLFECEVSDDSLRNRIDKFCLDKLLRTHDTSACKYVLDNFCGNHSNSEIFSSYLRMVLLTDYNSHNLIVNTLNRSYDSMLHFSKHWVLTCFIQLNNTDLEFEERFILKVMNDFKNRNNPDIFRALCATFCMKYGAGTEKTRIRSEYQNCSDYIKIAIYLSVKKYIKGDQQRIMLRDWKNDSTYNEMIYSV